MGRKNRVVEAKYKQLKALPENAGKTKAELFAIAEEFITGINPLLGNDINIAAKFKDIGEQQMAQDLLGKYLRDYAIESISDKNILQEIIYLEVVQLRLQEKLNDMYEKEAKVLPLNIIDTIHKNSDAIVKLKNTLGLNKSRDKLNTYDVLDHLKRRFKVWRENNQASRTVKCPYCWKFILLKMRTDAWETQGHPFFKDNMVYNKHLFAHLGQTVNIDRNFIAGVLETSPDYVEWVINKVQQPEGVPTNGSEEKGQGKEEVIAFPDQSVVEPQLPQTGEITDVESTKE